MQAHRLRAPSGDSSVLAEPGLDQAGGKLSENLAHLAGWEHDFQGRRADRLRAMARRDVLAGVREHHAQFGLKLPEGLETAKRWVATGHQPELFHPGVWIKNFATAAIAREAVAVPLNVIVDNDIPKNASLRVPVRIEDGYGSRLVDFDDWAGEIPYEDWAVGREDVFEGFDERVREALNGLISDPIIDDAWPMAREAAFATDRVGLRLASARKGVEASWGVHNAEVPLGKICETESFHWFASHLLAQLPRFRSVHNAALGRYRALYHIRSKNHPVPALDREGDWIEAPFWVWRKAQPRRRPLMARQRGKELDLRIAGEADILDTLPLGPDRDACCAVDQLRTLAESGVRIRTRALTTTMFLRLLVGDLFLHGIGGAKYDELGDEVVRGFFGIEPPSYLTLSMTMWLGLDADLTATMRRRDLQRAIRDLTFHPDRALAETADPRLRGWIEAKREAILGPVETRRQRVARFHAIRTANEALQAAVAGKRTSLREESVRLSAELRKNALATGREWGFPVHSKSRLHNAFRQVVPGAFDFSENEKPTAQKFTANGSPTL